MQRLPRWAPSVVRTPLIASQRTPPPPDLFCRSLFCFSLFLVVFTNVVLHLEADPRQQLETDYLGYECGKGEGPEGFGEYLSSPRPLGVQNLSWSMNEIPLLDLSVYRTVAPQLQSLLRAQQWTRFLREATDVVRTASLRSVCIAKCPLDWRAESVNFYGWETAEGHFVEPRDEPLRTGYAVRDMGKCLFLNESDVRLARQVAWQVKKLFFHRHHRWGLDDNNNHTKEEPDGWTAVALKITRPVAVVVRQGIFSLWRLPPSFGPSPPTTTTVKEPAKQGRSRYGKWVKAELAEWSNEAPPSVSPYATPARRRRRRFFSQWWNRTAKHPEELAKRVDSAERQIMSAWGSPRFLVLLVLVVGCLFPLVLFLLSVLNATWLPLVWALLCAALLIDRALRFFSKEGSCLGDGAWYVRTIGTWLVVPACGVWLRLSAASPYVHRVGLCIVRTRWLAATVLVGVSVGLTVAQHWWSRIGMASQLAPTGTWRGYALLVVKHLELCTDDTLTNFPVLVLLFLMVVEETGHIDPPQRLIRSFFGQVWRSLGTLFVSAVVQRVLFGFTEQIHHDVLTPLGSILCFSTTCIVSLAITRRSDFLQGLVDICHPRMFSSILQCFVELLALFVVMCITGRLIARLVFEISSRLAFVCSALTTEPRDFEALELFLPIACCFLIAGNAVFYVNVAAVIQRVFLMRAQQPQSEARLFVVQ